MEWILKNTKLRVGDEFAFNAPNNEIMVIDSKNNLLGTFHDYDNWLPREPENKKGLIHTYEFNDAFIKIENSEYPPIKLRGILFKYDTFTISSKTEISFKLMAKAIIKDIITGESHLYNKTSENSITSFDSQ